MKQRGRGRVSSRQETPAGESSGVGYGEGGCKASGVAKNPRGNCQGVGGGVESPRGTDNPGVEELPRGDKTSGVTPEGNRVPGADGRGQGGDGNSPATRDTKGRSNTSRGEEMEIDQDLAAPPIPQRGMEKGERGEVITKSHSNSDDGARPEQGALVRCKYGLLAPYEPTGDLAAAGPHGSEKIPEDTTGTGGTNRREMGTWERNK